jgi:hypothetical protein
MDRVIAVTPAGRQRYLALLQHYVLADPGIAEWHLWDNCRNPADRAYIEALARQHDRIRIVRLNDTDGSNRAINQFYQLCNDPGCFYIKMDDDLVYLPENFAARLHQAALAERERFIWWSPLVVNNAICSWLLKYHSRMAISANLSCQSACLHGWRDPQFAIALHRAFLDALRTRRTSAFAVPNFGVALARFSINCIGFFGTDVAALGETFCPPDVDDEEYISAVLPSLVGRPGRVVGALQVGHFSYFTQEPELLQTDILDRYYAHAGVELVPYAAPPRHWKDRVKRHLIARWRDGFHQYQITEQAPAAAAPARERLPIA